MNTFQVYNLSIGELNNMIEKAVTRSVQKCFTNQPSNKQEDISFLSKDETCSLLKISIPTLDKHIRSGRLTAKRLGRRVYITKESIDKALFDSNISFGGHNE